MDSIREWMVRCHWLAGWFLLGCGVFGSLWTGLYHLGDLTGARVCQGVFWGVICCGCLNGMVLVGLLSAAVLRQAPQTLPSSTSVRESPQPSLQEQQPVRR